MAARDIANGVASILSGVGAALSITLGAGNPRRDNYP